LPDTFASMTAARNSESADDAIGNVTGSNSVNVFLGLGLPWVIATATWSRNQDNERVIAAGGTYVVPSGELGFSVFMFLVVACICFVILIIRRFVSQFIRFN
jgi:solute carrier family 8 (sodium/calcium exchanger)